MKNNYEVKDLVELINLPIVIVDKKQNIIAENGYFLLLLKHFDISKKVELKQRINDFISKPEKFISLIGQKTQNLKELIPNQRINMLINVFNNMGYKTTHLTFISISLLENTLSDVFIFRIFGDSKGKVNEMYVIVFDFDILKIVFNVDKREYSLEIEEIKKKYTVLLQVANRVFSVVKGFTETIILGNYKDIEIINNFIRIIDSEVSQGIKILLSFNLSDNVDYINVQKVDLYNFLNNVINKYVEKLVNESHANFSYPNFIFDFYIQPNIPNVMVDPSKLELCLYNLLDNAIKFRDEKKEKNYVKFSAFFESSINRVIIIIEDNGIGMTEDEVKQLGQIFKTFDSRSGIGLGFYIVFKIAKQMGWEIKVESKKNEYTKVTIAIPTTYV